MSPNLGVTFKEKVKRKKNILMFVDVAKMRNHIQAKHIYPVEKKEGPSQERLLAKQNKVQKLLNQQILERFFLQKQSKVLFQYQIYNV